MRLNGKPVGEQIKIQTKQQCVALRENGVVPTVAVVRVGDHAEDITYENRVLKNCQEVGFSSKQVILPETVSQEQVLEQIYDLNEDRDVRGILVLRPLPAHLDEFQIGNAIAPEKDIDCMNGVNLSNLLIGNPHRISPCTPEAVIAMLKYYNIPMKGRQVVIVNRSLVLGKPLSLLFLEEDATVTICHSKTVNLAELTGKGDIVVTGIGKARFFDSTYFKEDAVVIDVGINFLDGSLCGDVDYEQVFDRVKGLSPVPGGVGTVTSSVLLYHCVK